MTIIYNTCLNAQLVNTKDKLDEIYILLVYETPWGARNVEDWDFRFGGSYWYQVDPAVPASIYHERLSDVLIKQSIYGEAP